MTSVTAVPRAFFCEHSASASRVLVLLAREGHHDSLQTVLTCHDADLAQRIAVALGQAAVGGRGPAVAAELERLADQAPAEVASVVRRATDLVFSGRWPVAEYAHRRLSPQESGNGAPPAGTVDALARTPASARLADLSGTVVRIVQMLELHVHDADRLRAAAAAAGWQPAGPDQSGEDVVSAAMTLADATFLIPGADLISMESSGEVLRTAAGDELADWSVEPVLVEFGGWRVGDVDLAEVDQLPGFDYAPGASSAAGAVADPVTPDFATLFSPNRHGGQAWLTPRTADALHTALSVLADEAYQDVEENGDQPVAGSNDPAWTVFTRLPRISWHRDAAWRYRMARAAEDLRRDLEAGRLPIPRCTAEELMLHLAIEDAESMTQDGLLGRHHERLPRHDDDYDWELCVELLFQDHDVRLLYADWADGIEDPETELNQAFGIGDLRPDNWFTPFDNVEPRDH